MRQKSDNDEEFNPYEPGDAPVERTPNQLDDRQYITASDPPSKPTLGRWLKNFLIVLSRAPKPVMGGWLTLAGGYLVIGSAIASLLYLLIPPSFWSGRLPKTGKAIVLLTSLPILLAGIGAIGAVCLGPLRVLREVAFRGEPTVATIRSATRLSLEKFWSIVGVTLGSMVALVSCTGGVQVLVRFWLARSTRYPLLYGSYFLAVVGVWLIFVYFSAPLLYLVAATKLELRDAISHTIEITFGHAVYLLSGHLLVALCATGIDVLSAFVVNHYGPAVGIPVPGFAAATIIVAPGALVAYFAYGTLFATIEETTGLFRL